MKAKDLQSIEKQIKELKNYKAVLKKELIFKLGELSYEAAVKNDFSGLPSDINTLIKKYGFAAAREVKNGKSTKPNTLKRDV